MSWRNVLLALGTLVPVSAVNVGCSSGPAEPQTAKAQAAGKAGASAGEHPAEHAHSPPTGRPSPLISKDDLADAIERYVKHESALKGGFFLVYDKVTGRTLQFTLEGVHRERLAHVGEGTYFACVDFKTPEGKVYDLDIFMKGPSKDKLEVTEISIHKEGGKERYRWAERDGVWSKVPAEP
jgi:hypothetical protein